MKVIYGRGPIDPLERNVVLVIGIFDGLHRGHQLLIEKAIRRAKILGVKTAVMTFHPHPIHVLHPQENFSFITTLPHRLKLLESFGVDLTIVVSFTKKFSRFSPQEFIKKYLVDFLKPKEIFVGDDFRFGQNRLGTLDLFQEAGKKYGFNVHVVHPLGIPQRLAGKNLRVKKISSTSIRYLIADGYLRNAKKLLGRPISILGKVVHGDKRGKTLGFPTANIDPGERIVMPLGVFAVQGYIGKKLFFGMANIGQRPSFENSKNKVYCEVHIFGLHQNLYGRDILIELLYKIRDEKQFTTQQELINQIKKDERRVKSLLKLTA